ncbi:hypothetical protein CSX02_05655 [Agathobacter ruminis]|uniref:Uncharacterized protein n=1 Tax=Agathobacter ruminis TaxID=1712665 RepID=A0A2G3E461_9FIRM|nr:hypothetical protein CSX02_05655 [Agathobacter ruminis]
MRSTYTIVFVCPPTINLFFKIVQAFKRHMSISMRAFAYMKTKIFLQSEGRTGTMGRGCQAIHAVNGNRAERGL